MAHQWGVFVDWVWSSAPTQWLTTVCSVPEDTTSSSGLHGHHKHMVHEHTHRQNNKTHKTKISLRNIFGASIMARNAPPLGTTHPGQSFLSIILSDVHRILPDGNQPPCRGSLRVKWPKCWIKLKRKYEENWGGFFFWFLSYILYKITYGFLVPSERTRFQNA